jgi:hypothetical protein
MRLLIAIASTEKIQRLVQRQNPAPKKRKKNSKAARAIRLSASFVFLVLFFSWRARPFSCFPFPAN